jgi:hypothetical protein
MGVYSLETGIVNGAALRIQHCFRHFLKGRRVRNIMKYKHRNLWKLKSFAVMSALDDTSFIYCKSYKEYVDRVYKSIEVWIHQDSDDEEDYSLSTEQIAMIDELKQKSHIYYRDIKKLLKMLTLDQLQLIQ